MSSTEVMLNNYSDDAKIKSYISDVLMPRVFHDIPLNVLNTGHFSVINEYISQALEQQSYTASFFFNESFITKAVLPDSIYSEAAIFDIGYSYAIPSSCNFLLELKIEDIYNNAVLNPDTGLYEFILDKDTKFNLSNGSVYSLDYDILIQYKNIETSSRSAAIPAWNIQYTNMNETNSIAKNKNQYIMYRVSDVWLCLFVQASEYERQTHVVVNNMTNGIPNVDKVIMCNNHICGFDIKYIDGKGNARYIPQDHILPIHSTVNDYEPYVHYIMDNPQTIRFMFQLNGNKYFVPDLNSSFEITIYTCHGEAANFTSFKNNEQPNVITASNRYSNNGNVMKAVFVISGSLGGTNIGTVETVRRETIEAYNTANVISSDHDIDEWFKTFFFKNVLYPFFFKRRDDPWGRIWSGYLALKDDDDYIFRTNTLHCKIPYNVLYNNNDNDEQSNEIIIPPGWIWTYGNENRFTIVPYTKGDNKSVECANTLANINEKFIFSNPFGIRIQKSPFAIGYFNPWVNQNVTATKVEVLSNKQNQVVDNNKEDISYIYHAIPITTNIKRTYRENYYNITTYISPTIGSWHDGSNLVDYLKQNAVAPIFTTAMWNYFKEPQDMFSTDIPVLVLNSSNGYIPFNPSRTYFCVRDKNRVDDDTWSLNDIWIDDFSEIESKRIMIPITGEITMLYGSDKVWGDNGLCEPVYVTTELDIGIFPSISDETPLTFERIDIHNYYEMRLSENAQYGTISEVTVSEAVLTDLHKFGEDVLTRVGKRYAPTTYINIRFSNGRVVTYTISNAESIYMPYEISYVNDNGESVFQLDNVGSNGVILYAEMKPTPTSGAIDHYRVPFNSIDKNVAMFYIQNKLLPLYLNNMRVILHAMVNGSETGRVEMQPVRKETDGSYLYTANMYPLNQLVDVDNMINIASTTNGGGSWISTLEGSPVSINATTPELQISILIRSEDSLRDSDISIGDDFTGFRLVDRYVLDDVELVSELKDMRSVVNFGETSEPTEDELLLYKSMIGLSNYSDEGSIWTLEQYSYDRIHGVIKTPYTNIKSIASKTLKSYNSYANEYLTIQGVKSLTNEMVIVRKTLENIINDKVEGNSIDWLKTWEVFHMYPTYINQAFDICNVNGGVEIQLVPVVEYSLMNSDRFESFVSAFTHVNEAIEPVIMKRLEGNNYLDCKLIATYGLPHSYCSDTDVDLPEKYWADLNIQLEFNVKLYNNALATNTIDDLRLIIKSYFNRLTNIHTPVDMIGMDNNIYISHVIQQIEQHSNVAYTKFVGWYTTEKDIVNGSYLDPSTQCIVQKWSKIEDFPKKKLESFTPEMFVMDDENIVINLL